MRHIPTFSRFLNESNSDDRYFSDRPFMVDGKPAYGTRDAFTMDYSDLMNDLFSGVPEGEWAEDFGGFVEFWGLDLEMPRNLKKFMDAIQEVDPASEGDDVTPEQVETAWREAEEMYED